jgi:hypothetical protein
MKTETITCACGTVFQWQPDADDDWMFNISQPKACPSCAERIDAEREKQHRIEREAKLAEYAERIASAVDGATPAIFFATDTSHPKFNAAAWQRVKSWQPTAEKPWLGLVGATGTSKTRIGYLIARQEIMRLARDSMTKNGASHAKAPTFAMIPSYAITDLCAKLNAQDFRDKDRTRDELTRLRNVDFLMIDDLGKGRLSPAVASELFALVDHRYANALPMLWTANTPPEAIAASLSDDMGGPFAGRLNDSSRILRFK